MILRNFSSALRILYINILSKNNVDLDIKQKNNSIVLNYNYISSDSIVVPIYSRFNITNGYRLVRESTGMGRC